MTARDLKLFTLLAMLAIPYFGVRQHASSGPARVTSDGRTVLSDIPMTEFLIEGSGAPRPDYGLCQREIPAFEKILAGNGLKTIAGVTCLSVDTDPDSYAPTFQAISNSDLSVKPVLGARFSTMSFCEAAAVRMNAELARGTKVLEVACSPILSSAVSSDSEPLYQPVIVTLTMNDDHAPKIYSSIEVLVESTSATTRRDLAGAEDETPVPPVDSADSAAN